MTVIAFLFLGQKFALMEEKIIVALVLHHFHIQALHKPSDFALLPELILRPRDGIRLAMEEVDIELGVVHVLNQEHNNR